ncbi:hypothetical protein RRF57_001337 [Xylaria bambusicola]|uniref:Protein kinase domain-containing protein n=1 Tax=Xylaria bambusicola TaxID=326684 RepID=A0AAN7UH48_9PEZI
MERLASTESVIKLPSSVPAHKERRSAMKSAISKKSQVQVHVQFAELSSDYTLSPLSPRSPNIERSAPRLEYRPALQRSISNTTIKYNAPKSNLAYETSPPLKVSNDITAAVSSSPFTEEDGYFTSANRRFHGETGNHLSDDRHIPITGIPSPGERSSARVCFRDTDNVEVLKNIMNTLRINKIPGPQLFRSQTEFLRVLGFGSEGNVRGIDDLVDKSISRLKISRRPKWERFAIKRHGPQDGQPVYKLKNYLAAAEAEINALSNLLRGHPNIVQLRGWGLCLDTLERSQRISELQKDLSPSNLQLPLLVLERADGDLAAFLEYVFEDDKNIEISECSQEAVAEAGLSQPRENQAAETRSSPSMTASGIPGPEGVSLSGATLLGNDDEPPKYFTVQNQSQEALSKPSRFKIISGMNRHELLRRLCIDIGHGLQGLHELNMTHGDLKPRNVLVFREGPKWTAKLCDFGHSNSFDSSNDLVPYLGTAHWRPYWFGATDELHNIATLQTFDLAVYGAVVWSMFCPDLRGKAPPISDDFPDSDPRIHFGRHLKDMNPAECGPSILGSKAALLRRVSRLVHGTLCASYVASGELDEAEPHLRYHVDERPWEHLYSKTARSTRALLSHLPAIKNNTKQKMKSQSSIAEASMQIHRNSAIGIREHRHFEATTNSCYQGTNTERWRVRWDEEHHVTDHQVTAISSDSESMKLLHDDLKWIINDPLKGLAQRQLLLKLAHLRATKVRSTIWNGIPSRDNIVQIALEATPPLDIRILAWLCKGEVGAEEVLSLPTVYSVWKAILTPGDLSESERLERFLLLMYSGARIEQPLYYRPIIKEPKPVLNLYLHSCRLATRAVVTNEICRHYERILAGAESKPSKPDATRYYMTASRSCRPKGMSDDPATIASSTALGNIEADRRDHKAAYPVLKLNFEQLLDEKNDMHRVHIARSSRTPNERTPLLTAPQTKPMPSDDALTAGTSNYMSTERAIQDGLAVLHSKPEDLSLPPPTIKPSVPGWSESGNAFINNLTRSVTFKRPTVKLSSLRKVSIGQIGSTNVLEIDIADFILPGDPEEDHHALRQRIQKRFPLFDDAWYFDEKNQSLSSFDGDEGNDEDDDNNDVLASLRDDERWEQEPTAELLSAFEIKPPDFSAEVFLSKNLSTLFFFIQYPTTALGLLWELVLWVHELAGEPIVVSYVALREELRSLDTTRRPLLNLLRWVPMVFGRVVVLLLAGVVCLLGAALVVVVVLAFMLG